MDLIQFIDQDFEHSELVGWTTPSYYFWDETQAGCYGPYETRMLAADALRKYILELV